MKFKLHRLAYIPKRTTTFSERRNRTNISRILNAQIIRQIQPRNVSLVQERLYNRLSPAKRLQENIAL